MLIALIIGVSGLAAVALAYVNRDPLAGDAPARVTLPYAVATLVVVALAVVVFLLTGHATQTPGCGSTSN